MASSGWQNEQTWFTYSSNIHLIGNIYVSGITHSGSNLRIWGTIAAGARGSNNYRFYYSDYTSYAQPEGGNKMALGGKGKTWKVGDADTYVNFDVTLTGVPAGTTSRSFFVNFYGPNTNSVQATLRWNLSFSAGGSAPSGGNITFNSSTWNKINATSSVSSWGGLAGSFQSIVVTGSYNGDAVNSTSENFRGRKCYVSNAGSTSVTTFTSDMSDSNVTMTFESPISIKGLLCYRLAYWHSNSAGVSYGIKSTVRHLPPAKPLITYTDPGGSGTKNYTINVTGDTVNNHTTYDAAGLTRSIRYKINNGDWVNVDSDTVAALDATKTFTVSVSGGATATIESWMTYHGLQSEVKSISIFNGNAPSRVYGSVEGQSKLFTKLYGSVEGQSKEIVKLYGSVEGKAKSILG